MKYQFVNIRKTSLFKFIYCSVVILIGISFSACQQESNTMDQEMSSELLIQSDQLIIPGTIYPARYNGYHDRQNGHHFIVWQNGNTAQKALINTPDSDEAILDALEQMGAAPGNNLTEAAWSQRMNQNSEAPDQPVEGTSINVSIRWENQELPAYKLFQEITQMDIVIKVGGHRHLIPVWRSGCVTCLFSCPGGKTSNAAYTIRDQAFDQFSFWADESILPPDGTEVLVIMELPQSS